MRSRLLPCKGKQFPSGTHHNQAAVAAIQERFADASGRAGIKAELLTLSASLVSAGDQFGRIARRFDLAVVGQAEPKTNAVEGIIVEAALFDSGRPVIIVPYIQKAPLKLDRVMVCWDGGRVAARAPMWARIWLATGST
jgi:hypothetical protein